MIVKLEDLADVRKKHENEKLVLTSGTYDLLHVGHLRYLSKVQALGDILVVMLSGDDRVKARKGPSRPIIPENDRAQLLNALKMVDYVFIDPSTRLPGETDPVYAEIIESLQPDMYVTDGPDPRLWNIMEKSKLVIIPRSEAEGHASTSAIIQHIIKQS